MRHLAQRASDLAAETAAIFANFFVWTTAASGAAMAIIEYGHLLYPGNHQLAAGTPILGIVTGLSLLLLIITGSAWVRRYRRQRAAKGTNRTPGSL